MTNVPDLFSLAKVMGIIIVLVLFPPLPLSTIPERNLSLSNNRLNSHSVCVNVASFLLH
ncbi:hypothetical protein Gmet_3592 [Geobacter metallireducens GS-15]|uniref:Uncharacterized protein n=1 Tax=Geobacter metallireducens (strain ATCC 53774 / DSM 7210 / GS-15) TaxID=269799 RepID=J7M085_GEOMG|nr:hypothetical protein Gmet_3592 [Geobacter metallireducens GS-15]